MNDKVSKIQSLNEEQQQLKKRARRRLVGAVALVLVMVIVLPMILDKQPKAINQDVKIEIPDQAATNLPALATPANEPVASEVSEPAIVTSGDTPTQSTVATIPQDSNTVAAPAVDKQKEAAGLAEAEKKQQQLEAEKKADAERKLAADKKKQAELEKANKEKQAALAALQAKPAENKPEQTASTHSDKAKKPFAVQFAALNDGSKARDLLQKLSGHGIKAFVVTVHTDKGEFSKVRAGPFSSKEEAEFVKKKAESAGLPALIIANQ